MVVLKVSSSLYWQDVSMKHMVMVSCFCEQHFLHELDNLVCVDVDMKFCDHVGMEILPPIWHPAPQFLLGVP